MPRETIHAPLPESHVFVTLTRGRRMKTYALRPALLYAALGVVPALCVATLATGAWFVFRDDLLGNLMARQAEMQYAYEDRLAAMRAQIDRVTSRQLLDQDSFEGKVHTLVSRQMQLENRSALVTALAQQMDGANPEAKKAPRPGKQPGPGAGSRTPLAAQDSATSLPAAARSYAPVKPVGGPEPEPETPLRSSSLDATPIPLKIDEIATSLDRIETDQIHAVSRLASRAQEQSKRARAALLEAGLAPDRLTPPAAKDAMGGPFIPLKVDANGSPFEREVARFQTAAIQNDKLQRLLPHVPLRTPALGGTEQTSGFGTRLDPFLGRPAFHAGLDFRGDVGAPVRATAGGKVVSAGYSGGYGNMVEIDHGNGLTTRYAHLSSITAGEDQYVAAGAVVGRLGSTGRSTGPHLHYEVRVDGQAVDPTRFLRAGRRLFEAQSD